MTDKVCGKCMYNRYSTECGSYYCGNEDSENNGTLTFYDDTCEDFEEKER